MSSCFRPGVSLNQLDSARMIADEMGRLDAFWKKKRSGWRKACEKLEHFQRVIEPDDGRSFLPRQEELEDRRMLACLFADRKTRPRRRQAAVGRFRQRADQVFEDLVKETAGAELELRPILSRRLDGQHRILDECRKHRNTYGQIPDYVGLREEINREFDRRKIRGAGAVCLRVCDPAERTKAGGMRSRHFWGRAVIPSLVDPEYITMWRTMC